MEFIQGLPNHIQAHAQEYNLHSMEQTLRQLASFTHGKHEQVKELQRLQATSPKMYPQRPCSWAAPKTPDTAVGQLSPTGGRLERWSGFFTPSAPRDTRGGKRLHRLRACRL